MIIRAKVLNGWLLGVGRLHVCGGVSAFMG